MKKSVLIPVAVIALCAALLLGVTALTFPMYLENYHGWHQKDLEMMLPGAKEFTREAYAGEDANIVSVHKADIGYVIETSMLSSDVSPVRLMI